LSPLLLYIPHSNCAHFQSEFCQKPLETFEVREAVTAETSIEYKIVNGKVSEKLYQKLTIQPHANMKFGPPELPDYKMEIEPLAQKKLGGMADLQKVVVVTGFAEVWS